MAKHYMSVVIDLTFDDLGEDMKIPTPSKIEQGMKSLLQQHGKWIGFDFNDYDHFEIVAAKGSLKQAFGVDD
jgi:hypothetical protein